VHILIGLVVLVAQEVLEAQTAVEGAVEEMMLLDFQLLQEMTLVMKLHLKESSSLQGLLSLENPLLEYHRPSSFIYLLCYILFAGFFLLMRVLF
jgi:hypothetical protein